MNKLHIRTEDGVTTLTLNGMKLDNATVTGIIYDAQKHLAIQLEIVPDEYSHTIIKSGGTTI